MEGIDVLEWGLLVALGFVAAAFGSIVGLGGGIIIVPSLVLLGPALTGKAIGHPTAVGTSLAVLIVTALASTLAYAKRRKVDFRSGWLLFAASGPSAMIGSALTAQLRNGTFQLVFGCFMLLMAALLVARDYIRPIRRQWPVRRTIAEADGTAYTYGYAVVPMLAVGCAVGAVSGLFGIGGGSLFVPVMVLLFGFPPHIATATSMFVIFLSSITGSAVHAWLGEIDYPLAAALLPGAWIGGRLGAYIAGRMSGKGLLWLLRLTLIALAAQMIVEGAAAQ